MCTGLRAWPAVRVAGGVVLLVAAAVAASVLVVATGMPPPPAAPPSAGRSVVVLATRDPAVDLGDADAVCEAFAAALFAITAAARRPHDSYRRAAAYTTRELAAALTAGQGRRPAGWDQHAAAGAAATLGVEVSAYAGDNLRPDTELVVYRAAVITTTAAGCQTTRERHIVYCTLKRPGAVWLVAAHERERTLS